MFGIGTGEIILIMIIAIMIVGPERMVEFSRTAGRLLAKFRLETDTVRQEFNEALGLEEVKEAFNEVQADLTSVKDDLSAGFGEMEAAAVEAGEAVESDPAPFPFTDGETVRKPVPSALFLEAVDDDKTEDEEDAEAIVVEVAEFVPRDEEVEPVFLDEVMLVIEEDEEIDQNDQESELGPIGEEITTVELVEDDLEHIAQDGEV